ncbi:phosphatase PAP2 family protein [bacterium]|nr:MAG: phosphatase PAP2 family protein [bacterium]
MKKPLLILLAALLAAPASAFDAPLRERLSAFDVPGVGQATAVADATAVEKAPAYAQGHYLEADQLDVVRNFPPPPAAGSPEYRSDFAVLHAWQARRTEEQCAAAQAQSKASFESMMGSVSPFPLPLTGEAKSFIAGMALDGGAAVAILKARFNRPRPPLTDPTLRACIELPKGKAYPSGHATMARLYALVLSDLVPARRAEFLAAGDLAATYRVLGGVHHPSDIAAGQMLGDTLFAELKRKPAFNAELARLRRSLP